MYHRQIDNDAYFLTRQYELLLRRMLRWEIKGFFGPNWYLDLSDHIHDIEDKIASERRLGLEQPSTSPFMYLDFFELIDLIFNTYWTEVFSRKLQSADRRKRSDLHVLRGFRNKIGHMRAVTDSDFVLIKRKRLTNDRVAC